ncbi:right-handed parallel beta-helix repeat-containing protein [Aquimarina sp. M1]
MKTFKLLAFGFLIASFFLSCEKEEPSIEINQDLQDASATDQKKTIKVRNTSSLINAVENANEGDIIEIDKGNYILKKPLKLKKDMRLKGSGIGKTILRPHSSWIPETTSLPEEVNSSKVNKNAYLINMGYKNSGIKISGLSLIGKNLHGAIYGNDCDDIEINKVKLKDFLWCGIRTYRMDNAKIHDNIFEDAGGKFNRSTGGGIFVTWVKNSEFYNNRFIRSENSQRPFYGIKGRQGKNCRIYQNTFKVNFSIEFPFEHDANMEIDHNYISGTISIPKFGGGNVPPSGTTFHIHHNYFKSSYAIEGSRNGLEVNNNLFDFSTDKDKGNLVSSWSKSSPGPVKFHDNYIKNPGRGVFWTTHIYNGYEFYNNHVIANTTITPRKEGFFGFHKSTDFTTISIANNIIEAIELSRPLMRNDNSYNATIENNKLKNIKDRSKFSNPQNNSKKGPRGNGKFECGVSNEFKVNRWKISN